jgi:hypothetical protein
MLYRSMKKWTGAKIDPAFKKQWVQALQSGEYKQGNGTLREAQYNEDDTVASYAFCCLGVACDIKPGHKWSEHDSGVTLPDLGYGEGNGPAGLLLPLGDDGEYTNDQLLQDTLAAFNDNGATFAQIARWIDENL